MLTMETFIARHGIATGVGGKRPRGRVNVWTLYLWGPKNTEAEFVYHDLAGQPEPTAAMLLFALRADAETPGVTYGNFNDFCKATDRCPESRAALHLFAALGDQQERLFQCLGAAAYYDLMNETGKL